MLTLITAIGLLIIATGLVALFAPRLIRSFGRYLFDHAGYVIAAVLRLLFGAVFIVAAPATKLPAVAYTLGVLLIAAGLGILLVGRERMGRFVSWWLEQPGYVLRFAGLAGIAIGALVVWLAR